MHLFPNARQNPVVDGVSDCDLELHFVQNIRNVALQLFSGLVGADLRIIEDTKIGWCATNGDDLRTLSGKVLQLLRDKGYRAEPAIVIHDDRAVAFMPL